MSTREQLAEALRESAVTAELMQCNEGVPDAECPACSMPVQVAAATNGMPTDIYGSVEGIAALLTPLVEQIATERAVERAANELEKAAAEQEAESKVTSWTKGSHAGGHQCAAEFLRDRAAVLRSQFRTDSKGGQP